METYRFSDFAAPKYPPLAMQARIQGQVELLLTLRLGTGEVESAAGVSGHPLLVRSAVEAAKQWKFEPDFSDSGSLRVTLDYSLHCQ
jgi:TonB family protein